MKSRTSYRAVHHSYCVVRPTVTRLRSGQDLTSFDSSEGGSMIFLERMLRNRVSFCNLSYLRDPCVIWRSSEQLATEAELQDGWIPLQAAQSHSEPWDAAGRATGQWSKQRLSSSTTNCRKSVMGNENSSVAFRSGACKATNKRFLGVHGLGFLGYGFTALLEPDTRT